MVYVLQVERLENEINALIAAGAEVDPDEMRAEFEAALVAEPVTPTPLSPRAARMQNLMGA